MTSLKKIKIDYHRNGIMGVGFSVGIVEDEGQKRLIIQFNDNVLHTAVLDLEELKKEEITRAFRGDHFCDEFAKMVKEHHEEQEDHTEECYEYNLKYESDTPGECICKEEEK